MRLGKIYYNINESEYKVDYQNFTFYFSSILYERKFKAELNKYVSDESYKITSKYQNHIEATEFLALSLYKKIEKRGFYIKDIKTNTEINEEANFKIVLDE